MTTSASALAPAEHVSRHHIGRWITGVIALVCAAVALLILTWPKRPPNVVVIVVDTLRADKLGVYGNARGLTPFLDELAQRGAVFLNTYAASSWTCPSVASIMTSRFPTQHNVTGFGTPLVPDEVTFAEAMRPLGYVGGGFSANFRLLERLGYAQGFSFWRADVRMPGGVPGFELDQQIADWMHGTWSAWSMRPLLLYVQYMEPHAPYEPLEPWRSRFAPEVAEAGDRIHALQLEMLAGKWDQLTKADFRIFEDLYDGEVATADAAIRQLFAELERLGVLDNAIVIVTADHGEEFWEHNGLSHGRTLFNESVKVPLIVVAPGIAGGRRIATNVSLVDIAPTLIDLLGLPPESRFEGRSLEPLLRGEVSDSAPSAPAGAGGADGSGRDLILQLLPTGVLNDPHVHSEGLVRQSLKLLVHPDDTRDVFDLAADPGERDPNPASLTSETLVLSRALFASGAALRERASPQVGSEEINEATREKLRALGYRF